MTPAEQKRVDEIAHRHAKAQVGHIRRQHVARMANVSKATAEFWGRSHSDVGWLLDLVRQQAKKLDEFRAWVGDR